MSEQRKCWYRADAVKFPDIQWEPGTWLGWSQETDGRDVATVAIVEDEAGNIHLTWAPHIRFKNPNEVAR